MINEDSNIVLNKSSPNKLRMKPMDASDDIIESVCEQDYSENAMRKSYKSVRQIDDSTSVQCSTIFRPKHLTKRPLNYPKLIKCRIYQRHATDSIRKTKSTALPATQLTRNNWQSRGETVSTPDLADNSIDNVNFIEERLRNDEQQRVYLNRVTICCDNIRWMCVFLNCVILILSFLFFGSALAFTVSKEILLLIMKTKLYVFLLVSFYLISFVFLMIGISGLYVLWKMSRKIKIHAILTFILGVITVFIIFLQISIQKTVETNLQSHLTSSITLSIEDYPKDSWDYFHNTFKCCGVTGFLDWCYQENVYPKINETTTEKFLGIYVCLIPSSCCISQHSEHEIHYRNKSSICMDSDSGKIRNLGCITFVRREIHHFAKMYKVITGGAAGTLMLLTIISMVLFTYLTR